MGRFKESLLSSALKEKGLNLQRLAERMKMPYATLKFRVSSGKYSIDELHQILHFAGKKFEEVFPSPFVFNPQRIELNLGKAARVPKAANKKRVPVKTLAQPLPADFVDFSKIHVPLEDQKTQDAPLQVPPATASDFVMEDIYEGGLPPS